MAARRNYTEEDVRAAVASSLSIAESLRRLGLRAAGGNRLTLKKLIERYGLSTAHFDPHRVQRTHLGPRPAKPLSEILVERSTYHRGHLKRRLYEE